MRHAKSVRLGNRLPIHRDTVSNSADAVRFLTAPTPIYRDRNRGAKVSIYFVEFTINAARTAQRLTIKKAGHLFEHPASNLRNSQCPNGIACATVAILD